MKKVILFSLIALAIGAAPVFAAAPGSDCANCPMHKMAAAKKCSGTMCPGKMAGVQTAAKNVTGGVEVTLTAKNKETIAQLQKLALAHYSGKDNMDPACPGRVQGAETKLENTADGARVLITGKTPEVVKQIQQASAKEHMKAGCPGKKESGKEAKASKKYVCPMNCAEADKPGKCPKCGMKMTEKK